MRRWLLFGLVLALLAPAAADAKRVRVFAVGPKVDLGWLDTRASYRAHLLALIDAERRGAGPARVQRGAGDVASRRLGRDRDLVALPEDLGLLAAFTGSRGAPARAVTADTGGLVAAVGGLIGAYAPQNAYYAKRWPALADRGLPTRLLAVALTDTFARTAVETFAELADRYDLWLVAGVNMAREWRVVCRDRATFRPPPGVTKCDVEDPARVAALGDPDEPGRDYAYEATVPEPVNMALVFDPDGRLVSKQVKTYLTPIELPGALDLMPGDVSDGLSVVRTPVGRLGIVTSKDAWMPDVTAKLDAGGAEILIQPEFFVGDTVRAEGMWAPDNLKASGYGALLRHPSLRALVLPSLTGNLYDFSADAQSHIALKPPVAGGGARALVGQPRAPGLVAVQRWVVGDPAFPGEPMAERRRRLGAAGAALLPGGPPCARPDEAAPCAGGQPEGVLVRDVRVGEVPRRHPRARRKHGSTPFTVSRPIAPSRAPQRNVTLAARGRRAWAAWEQGGRIRLAASRDGGRTWSRPLAPVRTARGRQWWPSLAAGRDGRLWLAWQDGTPGRMRARYATSRDGRRWSRPVALDRAGDRQWRPSVAALPGGGAFAAWIDERGAVPGEPVLLQAALYGARLRPSGPAEAGRRLDEGAPAELARTLDHAWAPSVAARGRDVLVTWLDFRSYEWDVYARRSRDGGATFAPEQVVNDTPDADEAIDDTPRAAFAGGAPFVAWTDYRKRDSALRPHPLQDVFGARPGEPNVRLDGDGMRQRLAFAPAVAAGVVAWQAHPRGDGDIQARVLGSRRVVRVDDAGGRPWNQWRPALSAAGRGRVLAAWEDDRDGPPNVFAASAPLRRLR